MGGGKRPKDTMLLVLAVGAFIVSATAYQNFFFPYKPGSGLPSGPVTKPQISCLNTQAPPPYNPGYTFRCPDTANITDWFDADGVLHRRIEHAPLKGVTPHMLRWFFSPGLILLHPFVNFNGQSVYWYKLWHPIDHDRLLPYVAPQPDILVPTLWVNVKETYRTIEKQKGYEINACISVSDIRITVQFRAPGGVILASLVNYPWYDSPEGLRFVDELVLGSNAPVLKRLNKILVQPALEDSFPGLLDQFTRHHVEEVGNWQVFLPEIYSKYSKAGILSNITKG